MSVPKDLDGVDAVWVESALVSAGLDIGVESVDVEQIAVGDGYIGLLGRIAITYSKGGASAPASLIVKLPSPEPGPQMLGTMLRLWEREGRFYRELAPHLDVRTPACYLSEEDPADQRVVLLLEDLTEFDRPDQLVGTTQERAEQAIDWLCAFHATTRGKPHDDAYMPWIPRTLDPIFTGLEPFIHANLEGFRATFATLMTPARCAFQDAAVADFHANLARDDDVYVIGHGDFRLDNMLFGVDGDLAVIDWQLLHAGPGMYDLTYFLVLSLTVEQRRAWEHSLLERYRTGLEKHGHEPPTAEELLDGYRTTIRYLTSILPVTQNLDFEVNDRARALASAMVDRAFTAADDHFAGS
jgi:hypothetical protein